MLELYTISATAYLCVDLLVQVLCRSCKLCKCYVEFGRSLSILGLARRNAVTNKESDRSLSVLKLTHTPKWLFDSDRTPKNLHS